jgi:hypothetical protein
VLLVEREANVQKNPVMELIAAAMIQYLDWKETIKSVNRPNSLVNLLVSALCVRKIPLYILKSLRIGPNEPPNMPIY